jgi:hypothetical protein
MLLVDEIALFMHRCVVAFFLYEHLVKTEQYKLIARASLSIDTLFVTKIIALLSLRINPEIRSKNSIQMYRSLHPKVNQLSYAYFTGAIIFDKKYYFVVK